MPGQIHHFDVVLHSAHNIVHVRFGILSTIISNSGGETLHHWCLLVSGNLLLKDEGVGIHVIRALEKETLPAHVTPNGWRNGRLASYQLAHWLR